MNQDSEREPNYEFNVNQYYEGNQEDINFFTMIGRMIENRNVGMLPIKFMDVMSKFILDSESAQFRMPRNSNNNNGPERMHEFDEQIHCAYCVESVSNDLNSYLQHIISRNHIQEQINLNNAMLKFITKSRNPDT